MTGSADEAARVVRSSLAGGDAPWVQLDERSFTVTLPGEHKLRTECHLAVGEHSLRVSAFVARCPDESREAVWRWLLERNARAYTVAFAVDRAGDIYLVGRLPLSAVTPADLDRVLGAVLELADSSFDPILRLGFAESIRAEWRWRLARGEPTHNLAVFDDLRPPS